MDRAIAKVTKDSENVSAGLQLFLDNIPQRDAGISESIDELLSLARGLAELRLNIFQFQRLPTQLESDVRLLLASFGQTLARVQKMFGETKAKKLNGERPYAHVWQRYCSTLEESEGGMMLFPRLELYSIFLADLIEAVRGEKQAPKSLARNRHQLGRLLVLQQPASNSGSGQSSPQTPYMPMPAGFGFPFPSSEDRGAYGPSSPTMSNSSWDTQTSSFTNDSTSTTATHWATLLFGSRMSASRFPTAMRCKSSVYGRPMPSALDRLADDHYYLVTKMFFEADNIEAHFYGRASDGRARILLAGTDPAGFQVTFCIPLTALKLAREGAALNLFRLDRESGSYQPWAKLCFLDYERQVLFYSIFAAMKNQDVTPPTGGLHVDHFYSKERSSDKECFGGQITHPPSYRHALRVFKDVATNSVRLEARPLRGPKQHVPIWTAFIGSQIKAGNWARRAGPSLVELKRLDQHVFVDSYIPTIGRNGRFQLHFAEKDDCDIFIRTIKELASSS